MVSYSCTKITLCTAGTRNVYEVKESTSSGTPIRKCFLAKLANGFQIEPFRRNAQTAKLMRFVLWKLPPPSPLFWVSGNKGGFSLEIELITGPKRTWNQLLRRRFAVRVFQLGLEIEHTKSSSYWSAYHPSCTVAMGRCVAHRED